VNGIVTLILAVLLLSPGILTAADRKTTQEPSVAATVKALPQKLDLNRVSLEELVGVPGIGPRLAQAIVDLRQKKGSFKRVEDLLEVTGIKEKKLAAITDYLEVVPPQISTLTTPAVPSR
jgi:competence protein ComEA